MPHHESILNVRYFDVLFCDFSIEGIGVMVFNAIFDNISVISWRLILLMEKTKVPGENHRLATSN